MLTYRQIVIFVIAILFPTNCKEIQLDREFSWLLRATKERPATTEWVFFDRLRQRVLRPQNKALLAEFEME